MVFKFLDYVNGTRNYLLIYQRELEVDFELFCAFAYKPPGIGYLLHLSFVESIVMWSNSMQAM